MTGIVVTENGRMVDAEVERIASILADYDPNIRLAWIEPEQRALNEEFPFAVLYDNPATGLTEIVCRLRENEIDHRVLHRVFGNDNRNGNVLDKIESEEAARKLVELKRQIDLEEEHKEMTTWMIQAKSGSTINGIRLE